MTHSFGYSVIAGAFIAAMATAQATTEATTTDGKLLSAIVIEEREHDLGAAIERYRALAGDATRDAEQRGRARLRLATALRRIGKRDEGEAILRELAGGEGALAADALRALQDPGDSIEARIRELVQDLGKGDPGDAEAQLVWLGQRAVPELIRVATEGVAARTTTRISRILLQIGGPAVLGWLREVRADAPALRQRAVVRGFSQSSHPTKPGYWPITASPAVRTEIVAFFDSKIAEVRGEAAEQLWSLVPAGRLIALAGDADVGVRQRALMSIATHWGNLRHEQGEIASLEAMMPLFEKGLGEIDPAQGKKLLDFLADGRAFSTSEGRGAFLRALRLPTFEPGLGSGINLPGGAEPNEHAGEVAAVAALLGPVDLVVASGRRRPTRRQIGLETFVATMLPYWREDTVDLVIALLRQGYRPNAIEDWLADHAQPRHAVALAELLPLWPGAGMHISRILRKVGVSADAFEPLRGFIDGVVAGKLPSLNAGVDWVAGVIGSIDDNRSAAFLRELAFEHDRVRLAIAGLLFAKNEPSRKVMRELLVREGDAARGVRSRMFDRLIELVDRAAIEEGFPRAYRLGIDATRSVDNVSVRGIALATGDLTQPDRYAPEDLARLVDRCLATGEAAAWEDLIGTDQRVSLSSRARAPEVWQVLVARALDCPLDNRAELVRQVLWRENLQGRQDLWTRALNHDDRAVKFAAVRSMAADGIDPKPQLATLRALADSDWGFAESIVQELGNTEDASFADVVRPFVKHEVQAVAYRAARALIQLTPQHAADDILPLLENGNPFGPSNLAEFASTLLDRRFVPALLTAMREPDTDRPGLTKALEAIRFYHEEQAHWQRVLSGAGIDADNAAAALIAQTHADRDPDIRRMAVTSLGKLGVLEAMPVLIELTRDADADVAARAKSALTEIHTRTGKDGSSAEKPGSGK